MLPPWSHCCTMSKYAISGIFTQEPAEHEGKLQKRGAENVSLRNNPTSDQLFLKISLSSDQLFLVRIDILAPVVPKVGGTAPWRR